MVSTPLQRSDVLETLRQHGYRLTTPRRVIIETIEDFDGAFTADDLLREVEERDPDVGRATVFRTLDVLGQLKIVDRIHAPDGCHSYVLGQGSDQHYHHLVCSSCGAVVPFEACNVEEIYDELRANTNFKISGHMLEVFGLCEVCQQ